MAKTRRKKRNRPAPQNNNIDLQIVTPGERVSVAGHRAEEGAQIASKNAKPVFVGRIYTGVNRGKVYPYAGKKRGGTVSPVPALSLSKRALGAMKRVVVGG